MLNKNKKNKNSNKLWRTSSLHTIEDAYKI